MLPSQCSGLCWPSFELLKNEWILMGQTSLILHPWKQSGINNYTDSSATIASLPEQKWSRISRGGWKTCNSFWTWKVISSSLWTKPSKEQSIFWTLWTKHFQMLCNQIPHHLKGMVIWKDWKQWKQMKLVKQAVKGSSCCGLFTVQLLYLCTYYSPRVWGTRTQGIIFCSSCIPDLLDNTG